MKVAGSLLSVNVGLPKNVSWHGENVFTGVFKEPVTGSRHVSRLNVEGDGQGDLAGHGGEQRAVFVYQIQSYRYWERELGRNDFVFGQFGENFTVDGLADDEVCVGDRYRIGGAVFEVTQPRVTCYRVGIRMNDPRVPALLVSHHRPGFYFRVLVEGDVQAGDDIHRISSGPENMTVAEVDGLLYLPGHGKQELLRALRIPALSSGWQASFHALLQREPGLGNVGLSVASPPPAWPGFRSLIVRDIRHETESVVSIRLADVDGNLLPPARPGQYLTLRIEPATTQPAALRNYSLFGPPNSGSYRIAVKREPGGVASKYLTETVRPGDRIQTAAPRGTFILEQDDAPVLLISVGIGVTPVLSMLHALAAAHSTREIWWLHGVRNGREHPFATEVRNLIDALPNARSVVCYSQPGRGDRKDRDYDYAGRLSAELLAEIELPPGAGAYLCGPSTFMDETSAALTARGLDPSRVRTEPFGPAPSMNPGLTRKPLRLPHPPAGTPGAGPVVEFARSNIAVPWNAAYSSILDFAEACDVPVRFSCRTGVCHNCETSMIAGAVEYEPDPLEPPSDGNALICCSRPRGGIVLDL